MLLFTYECNEQSTAELQKLSVFHTTVTYATAKLHILFEMDNQNTENIVNGHIFSSSELIDKVLNAIGLTRDALSTYQQYQYPNGDYMRLRVSNHGIFLQHWFDKNREARMDGQNVPKLDIGLNLAITFAPNEQECLAMGKPFPMKIKNVTAAKTQQGNNVKPQFKVRHICYYSWMLTQDDVDAISASLSNCVTNGEDYKEPLQGNPDKVVEWEDTSNLPPKKVEGNTLQQNKDNNKLNTEQYMNKKQIRLTESDLKQIVKESVNKILSEEYGTMSNQDKATMWNLNNSKKGGLHGYYNHSLGRHLSSDEVRKGMYNYEKGEEMPTELQVLLHLSDEVKDVLYDQDYIKFVDERLNNVLRKKLGEVSMICDRLINKAKMNIGQQPDENYFDR
jgi:hypothetical protein